MTYYLNQSDDIIYTLKTNGGLRPTDKAFVRVYILDELVLLPNNNGQHLHYYFVTYGAPTNVPPGG